MRLSLALAAVLCLGAFAPSCEAGHGAFAKIHNAKINLIKKVFHVGQGSSGCAPAPSCCAPAPAPSCCPAPAPSCGCEAPAPAPSCGCSAPAIEYAAPAIEYSAPIEYSSPAPVVSSCGCGG